MTNFLIPYTFVGGTKAKAEEVNANFTAIQAELTNKASVRGSQVVNFEVADATSNFHAINKTQMETSINNLNTTLNAEINKCAPNTGFKITSGNLNSNAQPDLLDVTDNTKIVFKIDGGTLYKPLEGNLVNGEKFKLTSIPSVLAATLSDGINNLYVNKTGECIGLTNRIFIQKQMPATLIERAWVQPVLSSNGTMGGNRFAVEASTNSGGTADVTGAWTMFDGKLQWSWSGKSNNADFITIYNPNPLKCTNIKIWNTPHDDVGVWTTGIVYGSSDNSIWTKLTTFSNSSMSSSSQWNIDLSSNTASFKFYKITLNSGISGYLRSGEILLTATEIFDGVKTNDIWLDTSTTPYSAKRYNGTGFEDFSYVPLPQTVTVQSGLIVDKTVISNYELNGYNEILALPNYEKEILLTAGSVFTVPFHGWIKNGEAMFVVCRGDKFTPSGVNYRFYPIKGI